MTNISPKVAREVAHHPDAEIFSRIALLKDAYEQGNKFPDDGTDQNESDFNAHMDATFYIPVDELRAIRPRTSAGALAKIEFHQWYAEASGSPEPAETGLEIAASDLSSLAASAITPARDIAVILAREWLQIENTFADIKGDDDASDALAGIQSEIASRLFRMPASTMAGIAAKIEVLARMDGIAPTESAALDDLFQAADYDERKLLISIVRDAKRLAEAA